MKFPRLAIVTAIMLSTMSGNSVEASDKLPARMIGGWLFTPGSPGKISPMLSTSNVPGPTARTIMIAELAAMPSRSIEVAGLVPKEVKLMLQRLDLTSLTLTCSKSRKEFGAVIFGNTLITVPINTVQDDRIGLTIRMAQSALPLVQFSGAARGNWSAKRHGQLRDFVLSYAGAGSTARFMIFLNFPAATLAKMQGRASLTIDIAPARNKFSLRKNRVFAGRKDIKFDTSGSRPAINALSNACDTYVSLINSK